MTVSDLYGVVKALHIASVTVFIGGLLSLSAASAAMQSGSPDRGHIQKVLRWNRCATTPALLMLWITGAVLAAVGHWFPTQWLFAKVPLALSLSGLHGWLSGRLRRLQQPLGQHFWTVPVAVVAVTISIVFFAVLKP